MNGLLPANERLEKMINRITWMCSACTNGSRPLLHNNSRKEESLSAEDKVIKSLIIQYAGKCDGKCGSRQLMEECRVVDVAALFGTGNGHNNNNHSF